MPTEPLTDADLASLAELDKAASPAPWESLQSAASVPLIQQYQANTRVALAARNALPSLLSRIAADGAEVERLTMFLKTAEETLAGIHGKGRVEELLDRNKALELEIERLRGIINSGAAELGNIVCTDGCDAGIILVDDYSPTHYDPEVKGQVYDHEYFSPLGDALIALHERLKDSGAA